MNEQDFQDFADQWIAAWQATGTGKVPSPGAITMSFQALKPYPLDAVRAALAQHMADPDCGQYPPKPADIVRRLSGGTEERALAAWSAVEEGIGRAGAWGSVQFSDPLIHHVIRDMGGWVKICHTQQDELAFRRAEFIKRYRYACQRPPASKGLSDYLPGLAEAHNRAAGMEPPAPQFIESPSGGGAGAPPQPGERGPALPAQPARAEGNGARRPPKVALPPPPESATEPTGRLADMVRQIAERARQRQAAQS